MDKNHPRVLVVDDEEDIRYILHEILYAEGYEVVSARNGAEGIERVEAERSKFDLILIDLIMPEIDGIQVLRNVKQCDPDIGAVMMTGYASVDSAVRCMKLGAYDYITKPFRKIEITVKLDEAFQKRRLMLNNKQLIRKLEQKNCELDQIRKKIEQWNVHLEQKVGLQTKKLHEGTDFLQSIFHAIRDGIFILDGKLRVVDVNPEMLQAFHLKTRDQAVGKPCYQAFRGCADVCDGCPCRAAFETGSPQTHRVSIQSPLGHQATYYDLFIHPLADGDETAKKIIVYARNVTEAVDLQQQLIYSERMAAMGEMAAQIGHELNNYLGGIWGNAQLIPVNIHAGALNRAVEKADLIYENAARMERFTKGLMNLSGTSMKKGFCDLNALVQETLQFLKPQNRYDEIVFVTDLEARLPRIQADPSQIQQILLNLINNSADAMESGEVRVHTAHHPLEDQIELSVSDTGPGIPKALQEKVFEPHFSMRENGHGFGLSVCYRIAENHHGTIEVESEVGKGAMFRILLPVNGKEDMHLQRSDSGVLAAPGIPESGSPVVA
ncbi:MAG: response regulator [Candidatus Latescibacteria bacterium]|nr:response regulator [Candidatus Latescibacterota bacterium]